MVAKMRELLLPSSLHTFARNTNFFTYLLMMSLILFALWWTRRCSSHLTPRDHRPMLEDIHLLLNPPHFTAGQLLEQRADANKRLIKAFGLTNTFVSPEPDIHRTFVRHARVLLKNTQKRDWKSFRDLSVRAVRATLPKPDHNQQIPYDVFIQIITVRIVLIGLLEVDTEVEDLDEEDILCTASQITRLWTLSKEGGHIPDSLLVDLNARLRNLIPDEERFPNPLDFVIPAWETLWRVVAVTIAYAHRNENMRQAFKEFALHAGEDGFRRKGSDGSSVNGIINESMRLHPPSKHIGRVVARSWLSHIIPRSLLQLAKYTPLHRLIYHTRRADILRVQISPSLWGSQAESFDASRHEDLNDEQEQVLRLVFGHGPNRCIAGHWAPVAAGVIVSAILESVDGDEWEVVEGPTIGGRVGWEGWEVRGLSP